MGKFECEYCGEEITGKKPWRRKYCSRECNGKSKTVEYTITECKNCGKNIAHKQQKRKYCSTACYNTDQHSGEDNYFYRESVSRKYGKNWESQRQKALKRDFNRCRICNISNKKCKEKFGRGLSVHHKTPIKMFDNKEKGNRLRNLISLCNKCHAKTEHSWAPD